MNHLPKHMLSHKVSLHKSQRTENILSIFSEHSRIKLEISKTRNFKTLIYWTIKQITEVPLCPSSPLNFSYLGGWQGEGQEQRIFSQLWKAIALTQTHLCIWHCSPSQWSFSFCLPTNPCLPLRPSLNSAFAVFNDFYFPSTYCPPLF